MSFGIVLALAVLALATMEAIPLLSWVFWIFAGAAALAGWYFRGRVISMSAAAPDVKPRMDAIDEAEQNAGEP